MIGGKEYFVIWFDNSYQGLVLDDNEMIISFSTLEKLERYLESINEKLESQELGTGLDFDQIHEWVKSPKAKSVDCDLLLNAWNMFGDIRSSIEGRNMDRKDNKHLEVYDKLFMGSDAGWFVTGEKTYKPEFSVKDIRELRAVLKEGMKLLKSRFDPELAR